MENSTSSTSELNKIDVARPFVDQNEVEAVRDVLLSGHYVSGPKVEKFERKFAEYLDVEHAVAVNSGTAALHIALAISGIGPGDEVIVPPMTFFSTITSVLHQNAVPIFADLDPETYCLDPTSVEEQISENTEAIIPVHLFGHSADMNEFLKLGQEYNLQIIEDAAQAHGTEYDNQKVGSIGDMGAFSFYATKHITTGEGGVLVLDDDEKAEKARMIRSHGMSDRDHHDYLGYNYRMNEIAGAMGVQQMDKIEELNEKRIENSDYLRSHIKKADIEWLDLPKFSDVVRPTYFWCAIQVDEGKLGMSTLDLREKLSEQGIETRQRYQEPLYHQKILTEKSAYPHGYPFNSKFYDKDIDYQNLHLDTAEKITGTLLGLPNHPGLEKNQLDRIIESLDKF